jgi:hypothetical protein
MRSDNRPSDRPRNNEGLFLNDRSSLANASESMKVAYSESRTVDWHEDHWDGSLGQVMLFIVAKELSARILQSMKD